MDDLEKTLRDIMVIDSHLHLGNLPYLNIPGANDEKIIPLPKKSGVKKVVASHYGSFFNMKYGSEKFFRLLDKYEGFLYGLLVFDPNQKEQSFDYINNFYSRNDIAGIKIHPSGHLHYPADPGYEKFWPLSEERNIPVLAHSWNPDVANKAQKFSDPFLFVDILKKHPGLRLILAHAGRRGSYPYKVIGPLGQYPNLYVDFAGDIFEPGLIEAYVERLGSGRLLFGTDLPWLDIRFYIINILCAGISDDDKKNILGLNSSNLFKIPGTGKV